MDLTYLAYSKARREHVEVGPIYSVANPLRLDRSIVEKRCSRKYRYIGWDGALVLNYLFQHEEIAKRGCFLYIVCCARCTLVAAGIPQEAR